MAYRVILMEDMGEGRPLIPLAYHYFAATDLFDDEDDLMAHIAKMLRNAIRNNEGP